MRTSQGCNFLSPRPLFAVSYVTTQHLPIQGMATLVSTCSGPILAEIFTSVASLSSSPDPKQQQNNEHSIGSSFQIYKGCLGKNQAIVNTTRTITWLGTCRTAPVYQSQQPLTNSTLNVMTQATTSSCLGLVSGVPASPLVPLHLNPFRVAEEVPMSLDDASIHLEPCGDFTLDIQPSPPDHKVL